MTASASAIEIATWAAQAADSKKADNIRIVDVSERLAITDCFVIASADGEAWVRGGSDDGHQVAVFAGAHSAAVFLPGFAGGDENDVIEFEPGRYFAGCYQVAMVNGVEGAAHNAQTVSFLVRCVIYHGVRCP